MGRLVKALRRKFKTPQEAARALGIDERLLKVPRLALDANVNNVLRPEDRAHYGDDESEVESESNLLEAAIDRELERIEGRLRDHDVSDQALEEIRPHVRQGLRKRLHRFLDGAFTARDSLPENAIHGGMGGRFAKVNRMAGDRRMAHDARARRDAERRSAERWGPEAARISVDHSGVQPSPSQTIAMDKQAGRWSRNAHERWGIGA
jgi:hypothetical protein